MINYLTSRRSVWAVATAAALAACGGGDGSSMSVTGLGSVTTALPATSGDNPAPSVGATPPSEAALAEITTEMSETAEAEQFAKLAPPDKILEDANNYGVGIDASIALADVTESSSVKRHTITLNGKVMPYVARAGHLIARRWQAVNDLPAHNPEAAIFYTSYTRDALPKENRPITFLWNGGPGSASIWLHMGSWGPKRLKSDAPTMVDNMTQPEHFPFEDNSISLLDQSDIVFVDPPGTGLSTAIAPFKNKDFWGTDSDAQVIADFITSYVNKYARQSSPKYLYGESYGGIRTPIVANLLTQAGTSEFDPEPSGNSAKVLTGFILNSPLIDYSSNCDMVNFVSCTGYIPSYAMAADYYKKSARRGNLSQADYLEELRGVARNYGKMIDSQYQMEEGWSGWFLNPKSSWEAFSETKKAVAEFAELDAYTGIDMQKWKEQLNIQPATFRTSIMPGFETGRYDARMKVPVDKNFPADDYINVGFLNEMKTYLPDFVNYRGVSSYQPLPSEPINNWAWNRAGEHQYYPQSVTDIQAVLTANPAAKLLILHGYEDVATPGFQTELDLERVNLKDRVPVKWFEGGHMIYNTEASREPLKQTLDAYFKDKAVVPAGPVKSPANLSVQSTR